MNIVQAIILGLIQGITEFVPVSSSGHLVIFHHLLGVEDGGLAFDVALHFGTLVALIGYFWRDLWQYLLSIFKKSEHTRLAWLLIMATVPGAIIGFLLESAAESKFRSPRLVAINLFTFGLVMLLAEKFYRGRTKHHKFDELTKNQALAMGFAQAAAVIPGVSRSGSTITTGMFMGLTREAATRFSFLLGVPIVAGAVLKIFTENQALEQLHSEQSIFAVGVLTAAVSGFMAIRFMLRYLSKNGLELFAYYRIAAGILVILLMQIKF